MGIIDVHWFKDPNTQKSYLLWKENNWPFWPSEIYIRRIEENGITFRPEWPAKSILKAKFFNEWYCVEAPWMIYRYSSMTQLLSHTIAHFTGSSFMLKANNQPYKKILDLAFS